MLLWVVKYKKILKIILIFVLKYFYDLLNLHRIIFRIVCMWLGFFTRKCIEHSSWYVLNAFRNCVFNYNR